MKSIAIITSGILPVPAVLGGAVENLIDFYIEENEQHPECCFTIYSIYHPHVEIIIKKQRSATYTYYHDKSLWYRFNKCIFKNTHKQFYYNYHLEFFLSKVLADISKKNFDVIVLENRPGFIIPVSKVTKAMLVLHLHNDLLNNRTLYSKDILKHCDKVITVSNYIKNRVQTIDASTNKIITVHNGIDLQAFSNAVAIDRKSLGFADDDFVLVYSGRLNPDKGIKELLEAMISLAPYPQIKLLVLGGSFFGNENEDNEFIQVLKQTAAPLKERIIFTGYVSYDKIPSYLKTANVAVIPSMWEDPFPTSVLEAMAAGLPIIATKSGGIPEEVNEDCCILINRENAIQNLVSAITDLFVSPSTLACMSEASKKHSIHYAKARFANEILRQIVTDNK